MMTAYPWPGNVRELRNVVMRFAVLDARRRADLFDVTPRRVGPVPSDEDLASMPFQSARQLVLESFESSYFPAVLRRAGGVVTRAAEISGMARSSFYRMLERHGAVGAKHEPE
jgi:DNA-binding NtrC family response regulator